jgi:predicted glycogen debranching enzyme
MSYISFNRSILSDYSIAKDKEFILVNASGAYCSSTVVNCNTRKYHGLLVAPQPQLDNNLHVLLSGLDETIIRKGQCNSLAIHQYPWLLYPQGYFFLESFVYKQIPEWIYIIEDIEIKKSFALSNDMDQLLISYEVLRADNVFQMQFQPFLAFRNIHRLQKANHFIYKKYRELINGAAFHLYEDYSPIYIQFSKKNKFIAIPDWYYKIEYLQELNRGYDFQEDLYSPGYFELSLKKGDQIIVSVSLRNSEPRSLKKKFNHLLSTETTIISFEDCLGLAADQFIIQKNHQFSIVAGWHWFGAWARDMFISFPGLTLSRGKVKFAEQILDTAIEYVKDGLFPNTGHADENDFNSVDAPLWFFWAVQQYCIHISDSFYIWKKYGETLKNILSHYKRGSRYNIKMETNGLIYAGEPDFALTWMDAIVEGKAVTPRIGMPVEINALWYNAVCFTIELASKANDSAFIREWENIPGNIKNAFEITYWDEKMGYLADCVKGNNKDWSLRPNQIFAISLPYSVVNKTIGASIVNVITKELLTPRGLRTLAVWDENYHNRYLGNQSNRDHAYHQGTVWPWLLGHYSEAYLKVNGKKGIHFIKSIYEGFKPTVFEHGLGSISEIYDGDEPHLPRGAISQAWSIAELIRIRTLLNKYESEEVFIEELSGEKAFSNTLKNLQTTQ